MSKSNTSLASSVISVGLVSVHSSATHKSMLSFHSRSRRHRRGKSRVVSKQDFYQRSIQSEVQSELTISDEEKIINGDVFSQDGTVEGDASSIEVRRGKSRAVSKQDFYQRSIQSEVQSELTISDGGNKNIGDVLSQDGTVEDDAASIEVSSYLFQI